MFGLVGRLLWVGLSFLFSATIAVIVLFAVGALWLGNEFAAEVDDPAMMIPAHFFGAIFFVGAVGPALTMLPGMAAVLIGEVLRLRSWLYYVAAGGIALAIIPWLAGRHSPDVETLPSADYMTIFASAGFTAGLVYWILAGRNA